MTEGGVVNRIVKVADLTPHPGNYQRHDATQVAGLRASLRKFKQVRSIVVQEAGPGQSATYLLVAGHGLTEAAKQEGITTLRADVIPADWPPVKVKAYLVSDNELARQSDPDSAQLAALLEEVRAQADAELLEATGYGDARLDALLADLEQSTLQDVGGEGGGSSSKRDLGDAKKQIKPVLYAEDIGTFERAIKLVGIPNRGEALIAICQEYIEKHGTEGEAEGQLDALLEGLTA